MNRAWNQWYTEATSGSRIERLLRRGASKVRRRMLRRDFDTWIEAIINKKNTSRLLKRITIHTYRRLLRKGMKKWEQYLEMILLNEHENNVMKIRLNRIFGRITNSLLFHAFNTWTHSTNESAKHELILKRCAYKIQNRAITVTYNAWIHFVNKNKHERKLLQRIFNQLSNRLANKGMVTWKVYNRKMQELERFQNRQEQLMWNLLARLCNQKCLKDLKHG